MVFGWGKKKPRSKPAPTFDEEYDDEFGYELDADSEDLSQTGGDVDLTDAPSGSPRRRPRAPQRPSRETTGRGRRDPAPTPRDADDATFVPQRERDATMGRPPAPAEPVEELDEYPDQTCFIEPPDETIVRIAGWLVATSGAARGRDHRLAPHTRIGTRPESELRLDDSFVSSRHAEIFIEGDEFVLRDLGSTNGTFRDGERVSELKLRDGDRLRFGQLEFVFACVRL